MVLLAILFFISSFLGGIIIINYFLSMLPRIAKVPAAFFVGTYLSTMLVFVTALLLRDTNDPLFYSLLTVLIFQICFVSLTFVKKRLLYIAQPSKFELLLLLSFFGFGWYIMQKSFGYTDNSFSIASNLYQDFGAHISIIRSFSIGDNIPPNFPFFAGFPLLYHFFFDFFIALYEKMGIRIDYANNFFSALNFAGVLALIFSLSQEMFGKKPLLGIIAVLLFIFNSSLSFLTAIEKYFGSQIVSTLYHHNVYLGDGPFGEHIVSIFWTLNTYLNQRHLLFSLGLGLLIMHIFYFCLTQKKVNLPWIFLACIVGLLPFWHTSVFLAIMSMAVITGGILFYLKKEWRGIAYFVIAAGLIALPQILFIKHYQSVSFAFFNSGFLVGDAFTLKSFTTYWLYNLGISIFLIPIGMYLAKKTGRLFILPIAALFILPNLFQFAPQMFDNHKFFNMFILLANIYTAYVLYVLFKKRVLFKILGILLLFLLTFSGMIDFMVMKNDVKAQIRDYPNSKFLTWITEHTDKNAVFLTNVDVYDPITFVGRKSFLGRPHHLWTYGIDPEERVKAKSMIFSSNDPKLVLSLLKKYHIDFVVFYKQSGGKKYNSILEKRLKIVYDDSAYLVLQAR